VGDEGLKAVAEHEVQRCARVIGDGAFAFPVVGVAEHEADLDILAGGRSEEGALKLCAALLQPRPGNPDGKKVSVIVHSCTVGYLAPGVERAFLAALKQSGFANAACEAVIFGGRHHRGEADSEFGIKLNVAVPFKLVDPVTRAPLPERPARAAPQPPPSTQLPEPVRAPEPPPARAEEPPPSAPEPQPIAEPDQPGLADESAPIEPPPPPGQQTHVFRTEEHGRGVFGSLMLAALLLFNLAMAVWLVGFWTGLFELADAVFSGGEWETKFRGLLGTELIVAIWIAGTVVLGLAAYVTRGTQVVVEEIVESPPAA
jgi:hypothetical protein